MLGLSFGSDALPSVPDFVPTPVSREIIRSSRFSGRKIHLANSARSTSEGLYTKSRTSRPLCFFLVRRLGVARGYEVPCPLRTKTNFRGTTPEPSRPPISPSTRSSLLCQAAGVIVSTVVWRGLQAVVKVELLALVHSIRTNQVLLCRIFFL